MQLMRNELSNFLHQQELVVRCTEQVEESPEEDYLHSIQMGREGDRGKKGERERWAGEEGRGGGGKGRGGEVQWCGCALLKKCVAVVRSDKRRCKARLKKSRSKVLQSKPGRIQVCRMG